MRLLPFLALLCALPQARADIPAPYDTEKADSRPMPAEEVARTMELPPGFKCQVFAAEPNVQQPIAMSWDTKGRLWIAENYTYAENPRRWDTNLRDRIVIFEDKDNDGKHDGRKVFWDKGTYLTSIEIGYGGVWALCPPNLLFIPDKNGDDVPDGEPQVVLEGFNNTTIGHNIANGLRWGPDGWLYGRQGITDNSIVGTPETPPEKRIKFNCAIWRYHPTKKIFEIVCQGGTNSWGMDWDANGELFWINTVIGHLFHGIPGAYYKRMFGTHLNPHVYETIDQTADHYHWDNGAETWDSIRKVGVSNKTDILGGGHAHVGCVIYNGGTWPKEYQGKLFTCNLHGNRINMDVLEREGCGFVAKHGQDFMKTKDKWFRGIDLSTGPDGNVFVIDWSDTGECHDNDGIHRSSGRIYKISYGEPKKLEPFDVAKMPPEAVRPLAGKNNWWATMARQLDYQRSGLPAPPRLPTVQNAQSTDGLERLHTASALQRLPIEARWPIATALAQHSEDASDRQQPLLIWYGIEPAVAADPTKAVALVATAKLPTVRRLVSRRLTEDFEKNAAAIEVLVAVAAKDAAAREDITRGMSAALQGVSTAPKPKGWDGLAETINASGSDELKSLVRDLSLVFGSGRAADDLIIIAKNVDGDANARRSALDALLRNPKPELFTVVRGLINDKVLGLPARVGLAKFGDADVPKALIPGWPERSQEWRAANVSTLVSRPAWAGALLTAIEQGKVARENLTPYQARQIRSLGDEKLNAQLTKVWGELRDTPEAKKQELAKWQSQLTKDAIAKADPRKGRLIFSGVCAACHKLYGQGNAIGPDLTGSDRHNLDYLLGNIVDPNALVPADYRVSVLKLKDGRVISGVIPEQNERTLTVQTPTERVTVERTQVLENQQLPSSLMPEGLLSALGEENVRHLFAYLMGYEQVELPQ